MDTPPKGSMYMYDYITSPLPPGSYRFHVSTDVTVSKTAEQLGNDKFFEVVGPRFTLAATEVAGVFPPRNGHGPFQDSLPQIVIKRRTLPWERPFDSQHKLKPSQDPNALPYSYPTPWLALLLFEESDNYSLAQGVPLETVVPGDVFTRLGSPANVLCDAVTVSADVIYQIMPSREELKLLAHARQVNIDDRELSVEGSDGWFSVIVANRVPSQGAKCRACLVSVEERIDLVPKDPPATYLPGAQAVQPDKFMLDFGVAEGPQYTVFEPHQPPGFGYVYTPPAQVSLVLLHSWQFSCVGVGTFYNLMQKLDVGMMGTVETPGRPMLTDTAHMKLTVQDRGGTDETALYRGPLVPFQLTRDPLGPYHSADQARRATPEAGVEDVSYAAAFEVGRLLAAADARLAQELMRWRRESFKQSARKDGLIAIQSAIDMNLPQALEEQLYTVLPPVVAAAALSTMAKGSGPIADPYGIKVTSKVAGMDPGAVSTAFGLASVLEAQTMLGMTPGTLGVEVGAVAQTSRAATTIDAVAADTAGLNRLNTARTRIIDNAKVRLGGA